MAARRVHISLDDDLLHRIDRDAETKSPFWLANSGNDNPEADRAARTDCASAIFQRRRSGNTWRAVAGLGIADLRL